MLSSIQMLASYSLYIDTIEGVCCSALVEYGFYYSKVDNKIKCNICGRIFNIVPTIRRHELFHGSCFNQSKLDELHGIVTAQATNTTSEMAVYSSNSNNYRVAAENRIAAERRNETARILAETSSYRSQQSMANFTGDVRLQQEQENTRFTEIAESSDLDIESRNPVRGELPTDRTLLQQQSPLYETYREIERNISRRHQQSDIRTLPNSRTSITSEDNTLQRSQQSPNSRTSITSEDNVLQRPQRIPDFRSLSNAEDIARVEYRSAEVNAANSIGVSTLDLQEMTPEQFRLKKLQQAENKRKDDIAKVREAERLKELERQENMRKALEAQQALEEDPKARLYCKDCGQKTKNLMETVFLPCRHIIYCDHCAEKYNNCTKCDHKILGTVRSFICGRGAKLTTCTVCMDDTISVVTLPCGHFSLCEHCAPNIKNCGVCRTYIRGTVKINYIKEMLREERERAENQ